MSATIDRDGGVVMTLASDPPRSTSLLTSPFRENFNFDWFTFDTTRYSTAPSTPTSDQENISPVSQAPQQIKLPSPPSKPLAWIWRCHLCGSKYPLSVTRRCLVDGHYYCSINQSATTSTATKNLRRRKKLQGCSSEFDFVGWKAWGEYRRKCMALKSYATGQTGPCMLSGCEGCDSPSQCTYENKPKIEVIKVEKYLDSKDLISSTVPKATSAVNPKKVIGTPNIGKRFYSSLTSSFPKDDLTTTVTTKTGTPNPFTADKLAQSPKSAIHSNQVNVDNVIPTKTSSPPSASHKSTTTKSQSTTPRHNTSNSNPTIKRNASTQSLLTDFLRPTKPSANANANAAKSKTQAQAQTQTEPITVKLDSNSSTSSSSSITSSGKKHRSVKWSKADLVMPGLTLQSHSQRQDHTRKDEDMAMDVDIDQVQHDRVRGGAEDVFQDVDLTEPDLRTASTSRSNGAGWFGYGSNKS